MVRLEFRTWATRRSPDTANMPDAEKAARGSAMDAPMMADLRMNDVLFMFSKLQRIDFFRLHRG